MLTCCSRIGGGHEAHVQAEEHSISCSVWWRGSDMPVTERVDDRTNRFWRLGKMYVKHIQYHIFQDLWGLFFLQWLRTTSPIRRKWRNCANNSRGTLRSSWTAFSDTYPADVSTLVFLPFAFVVCFLIFGIYPVFLSQILNYCFFLSAFFLVVWVHFWTYEKTRISNGK